MNAAKSIAILVGTFVLGVATPALAAKPVDACIASSEQGQEARARGKLVEATALFQQCVSARCPPLIAKDCADFLNAATRATPTVVLRVFDESTSTDAREVDVVLDGHTLPGANDGRALSLDPGPHVLVVTARGHEPTELRFVAEESVKSRVVEVRLRAPGAPVVAKNRDEIGSWQKPKRTTTTLVASAVLAGIGVAGFATFGIVGAGADADYRSLRDTYGTRAPQNEADAVRTRFQVADIGLVVGLVAAVAAGATFTFGPRE